MVGSTGVGGGALLVVSPSSSQLNCSLSIPAELQYAISSYSPSDRSPAMKNQSAKGAEEVSTDSFEAATGAIYQNVRSVGVPEALLSYRHEQCPLSLL